MLLRSRPRQRERDHVSKAGYKDAEYEVRHAKEGLIHS
jgi:hypothetical protein